ncbi:NUDIX hydrolase [Roseococcus sp. DSY-14]|uniref:NUDIX hydrolase n=1 Tax=Roseococcus sp. DSY-14 TaxID=3369650 RepID=UPI00387B3C44
MSREYPDRPWVGIGAVAFRGGAVLLVRRARPPRQGLWSLPGGAQHLGETAEAAARRELLEETGVELGPLVLADVVDAVTQDEAGRVRFHYTIVDYAGEWRAGEARAADDAQEVSWAPLDALDAYALTSETRRVIALARERLDARRRGAPA